MSDMTDTKKRMGNAFKAHFCKMVVPGEVSKKVSTKMQLDARLDSGADVVLACPEVRAGRPPGAYGLYWQFSISGGPILAAMEATGLAASASFHGPVVFALTSHNLPCGSHHEVFPGVDFDAVAAAIGRDMREYAFPLIEAFNSGFDQALDYILKRGPGGIRNPFTTCVILMHLARRPDRLEEIVHAASTKQGFYDFRGPAEADVRIVQPLARWFESHT